MVGTEGLSLPPRQQEELDSDFLVEVDSSQLAISEVPAGNTPNLGCSGLWLGAGRNEIVDAHKVFSAGKHGLSTVYPYRLETPPL